MEENNFSGQSLQYLEIMGYKVNPDKDEIKKLLKEIRKDLEEIIKETSLKDLEIAFPQLIKTLRILKDSAD